jgi:oligopeptide transport system permease protein
MTAPALRVLDAADFTPRQAPGFWSMAFRRLLKNRLAVAGLCVIGVFAVLGLLAPLIAPHDPQFQDLRHTFAPMSWDHIAGTDNLGRDWFSRLLYGARLSLAIGIFAQLIVLSIGLPLGLIAGYNGGFVDSVIMRFTDLVYAFPDLLLIILLRSVFGGGPLALFAIIGLVTWVDLARLVRAQALSLREREFVDAARSLGATDRAIIMRHILPNLAGPITVLVAFGVPRVVFIEAALSFIGIGVNAGTPSWGAMVQEGYIGIFSNPHLVIFPAAAIALLMLAFTFLGDGLRDALDPKIQVSPGTAAPQRDEMTRTIAVPVAVPDSEKRAA